MSDLPLDDVHRLLDVVENGIQELEALEGSTVDVADLPEICAVVIELNDWQQTAYNGNPLGLEPSVLSKFVKLRGRVPRQTARVVADRVRSYLRSQDQASDDVSIEPDLEDEGLDEVSPGSSAPAAQGSAVTVVAERWIAVPQRSEIRRKIEVVASLLESIIAQVGRSNAPPSEQAMTALERAELIAILETTLAVLRAPMAERGLMKKAGDALGRAAGKAAEKGVQEGVGAMMGVAKERLVELLGLLF